MLWSGPSTSGVFRTCLRGVPSNCVVHLPVGRDRTPYRYSTVGHPTVFGEWFGRETRPENDRTPGEIAGSHTRRERIGLERSAAVVRSGGGYRRDRVSNELTSAAFEWGGLCYHSRLIGQPSVQ